jgi:hypothetical protein
MLAVWHGHERQDHHTRSRTLINAYQERVSCPRGSSSAMVVVVHVPASRVCRQRRSVLP